jgi:phage-related protein
LHVINSIVETPLDSIAETVESLLDSLRGVLNIVNGIVETALNGVAELVKVLLDSLRSIFDVIDRIVVTALDRVAELIKVLLYVLTDVFGFAYAAAGPFGGTLGEIWWELVFLGGTARGKARTGSRNSPCCGTSQLRSPVCSLM